MGLDAVGIGRAAPDLRGFRDTGEPGKQDPGSGHAGCVTG